MIKEILKILVAPIFIYAIALIFAGILFESAQPWTKNTIFGIIMLVIGFLFCLNSLLLLKRKEAEIFKDGYIFCWGAIGVFVGLAHIINN